MDGSTKNAMQLRNRDCRIWHPLIPGVVRSGPFGQDPRHVRPLLAGLGCQRAWPSAPRCTPMPLGPSRARRAADGVNTLPEIDADRRAKCPRPPPWVESSRYWPSIKVLADDGIRLDSPKPVTALVDEDGLTPGVVEPNLVLQLGRINHAATDHAGPPGATPDYGTESPPREQPSGEGRAHALS